ncbi:hypothetical protein BFV94_0053 [Alteromonas macleodii]|uniref:Uncharacterized protein n=1 Tax=Alteromonas macleodii TaxID=28108 RepID=A0AB36G0L4_ALTMA|nr:hypothetical protein BFV94_0053 [Alteromonas macleodii]OES37882.1 hypothetical protein BFV93_0053 [Alteromonas macleodii]OES38221.1 hypothetical protein BFV95_0051 [Alteromonas macleodii]OES43111.1 hypothetical protein BFV96_0053 [Alteromonas macleodii]
MKSNSCRAQPSAFKHAHNSLLQSLSINYRHKKSSIKMLLFNV